MGHLRILVVEDKALLAEALVVALRSLGWDVHRLTLEEHPDVSADRLVQCAAAFEADVVLLEPMLGRCRDGADLVRPLTRGGAAVVALTWEQDQAQWGGWLREGARCVVAKTEPFSKLLMVLRQLEDHRPVLLADQRELLMLMWDQRHLEDEQDRRRLASLTPREREVLGALMEGLTIREVAVQSVVSELTVRAQVKSVLAKLGACNQVAAVSLAHRIGWQPPVTGCGVRPRSLPSGNDRRQPALTR